MWRVPAAKKIPCSHGTYAQCVPEHWNNIFILAFPAQLLILNCSRTCSKMSGKDSESDANKSDGFKGKESLGKSSAKGGGKGSDAATNPLYAPMITTAYRPPAKRMQNPMIRDDPVCQD